MRSRWQFGNEMSLMGRLSELTGKGMEDPRCTQACAEQGLARREVQRRALTNERMGARRLCDSGRAQALQVEAGVDSNRSPEQVPPGKDQRGGLRCGRRDAVVHKRLGASMGG